MKVTLDLIEGRLLWGKETAQNAIDRNGSKRYVCIGHWSSGASVGIQSFNLEKFEYCIEWEQIFTTKLMYYKVPEELRDQVTRFQVYKRLTES